VRIAISKVAPASIFSLKDAEELKSIARGWPAARSI